MMISICPPLADNPELNYCDGGWMNEQHAWEFCKDKGTEDCPLVTVEQRKLLQKDYLARTGFGKKYQQPDIARVFGEHPDAAIVAEELQAYWDNISTHIEAGDGYLLSGTVGTGKTFTLALTALQACRWRIETKYIYAPTLFGMLHRNDPALHMIRQCDLLLLDDFGTEYNTEWNISGFSDLVEHRHANELATCITTNLSINSLSTQVVFAREIDRWRETCSGRIYELAFDSLRTEGI